MATARAGRREVGREAPPLTKTWPSADTALIGADFLFKGFRIHSNISLFSSDDPVTPDFGSVQANLATLGLANQAQSHDAAVRVAKAPGAGAPGRWFERLIAHARVLSSGDFPVVLAGDYNVVPTDFDIYDTKSWKKDALLQPESRAAYQRLLAQGWTDALRTRHPGQQIFTFWDYFRQHWQRNSGLRIDHLLLSPDLAPRLLDAGVDRWVRGLEGASDHAPTWITLDTLDTLDTRDIGPARPTTPRPPAEPVATGSAKKTAKKTAAKTTPRAPATPTPAKKSASRKRA